MRMLRTAVVGLGRIGFQFHAPQVVRHEGFDLVAAVDPVPERLDDAREKFGVEGCYQSLETCLGVEDLDLVVIASPTRFHCSQALAAFERGCDVFCDKPMASSLEEADRMVAAMGTHGRKLMLYQPHRARAEVVALRDIIARGTIGPLYMIRRATYQYARRNDWQAFRKHGGGMLNNSGSHLVDQCLYLAGGQAERVRCALRRIASLGDADDVVRILIETTSDVVLDIDINMASAHDGPQWHVFGQHGSIVLEEGRKSWHVRYFRPEELEAIGVDDGLAAEARRYGAGETIPWREESVAVSDYERVDYYAMCYDYFGGEQEPFVPVADSREVMRVLAACREDAGQGA